MAHMRSPGGWVEPGQTPEFDEYTVVLRGMLRVEYKDNGRESALEVRAWPGGLAYTGRMGTIQHARTTKAPNTSLSAIPPFPWIP